MNRSIRVAKQGAAEDAIGEISKGCEIYILTFGQFSLIHALVAVLRKTGPAYVDVSTWTAARAHLEESLKLMENSVILRMRFLIDTSFINRQPEYCRRMRELFGDDSIRTCRNHSKFITVRNADWNIAMRTSMNLNENPRLENLEISDDAALCGFLVQVVDDIFREHVEGDFASDVPDLARIENVAIPGMVNYEPATAEKECSAGNVTWSKTD